MDSGIYSIINAFLLVLKNAESINRALFILDHTMSCETHKFGVVYVEAGQSKQDQILKNTFGSARYTTVSTRSNIFYLYFNTWVFNPK